MLPEFQTASFSAALTQITDSLAWNGADLAECAEAAAQVQEGDFESWHLAWLRLAERVRRHAAMKLSQTEREEARDSFLRAAHYYRLSGRFLSRTPGTDARISPTTAASQACFGIAMRLSVPVSEQHELSTDSDGVRHRVYFHPAHAAQSAPAPTLLVIGEGDTSALELYFACALAARQHGWHCLSAVVAPGNKAPEAAAAALAEALVAATASRISARADTSRLAVMVVRIDPLPPAPAPFTTPACWLRPIALESATQLSALLQSVHDAPLLRATEAIPLPSLADLHHNVGAWLENPLPLQLRL